MDLNRRQSIIDKQITTNGPSAHGMNVVIMEYLRTTGESKEMILHAYIGTFGGGCGGAKPAL